MLHTKQPFGNKVWDIIGKTAFITELVTHSHLLYVSVFYPIFRYKNIPYFSPMQIVQGCCENKITI